MRLTKLAGRSTSRGLLVVIAAGLVIALAALACGGSSSTETGGSGSTGGAATTDSSKTKVVSMGNAPQISAETLAHGKFDLAEFAGKPVVVNFWFPSCPPCRAEMPDLQEAYTEFKEQGVQFVGVQQLGIDSKEDAITFLEEVGVEYPNIPDENSAIQLEYKILAYPTTVFLDRNHDIVKKWNGLIAKEDLREQIENIAGS